ncbi:hypothetical protein ACJJVG_08790 [Pseudocitrobacter faecalis]|uniref:hypothetical protein n=1 Tax=Pseudocitrobacter faecalis TaxID=1398493 RepID=UPI003899B90A
MCNKAFDNIAKLYGLSVQEFFGEKGSAEWVRDLSGYYFKQLDSLDWYSSLKNNKLLFGNAYAAAKREGNEQTKASFFKMLVLHLSKDCADKLKAWRLFDESLGRTPDIIF